MNCRICDNDKLDLFYEQGDKNQFHFYKCRKCGLVNIDLSGLNIAKHQVKYSDGFNPVENYENENKARSTYHFIKKYIPVKGNFLDIGCGLGSVLYFAKKDGWNVKGLELSPDLAKYVHDTLNVEVYVADFLDFENTDDKYDVVSLRHVLEHLPNSFLALNKISALLKLTSFELVRWETYSHKPLTNFIYNRIKIGTKARAIVRKV